MTGDTSNIGSQFPTTAGAFQTGNPAGLGYSAAFVTKLNPTGSALVYSTFLGGRFFNYGNAIAMDTAGNAYVTGLTTSLDFPTTVGAVQPAIAGVNNAFVTKLNPTGSALVYSTYLGGSTADTGQGIAVDSSGNAYVTGLTNSLDFPTTAGAVQTAFGGAQDAFMTKVNATGSGLVYSTYLGGSGTDFGNAIAVDASGNAYVTGATVSANFPVTAGAFQTAFAGTGTGPGYNAFVAKLGEANTNAPPVCTAAQPSVRSLWAPNSQMVSVSITGITDPTNDPITLTYPLVTQDEPIRGLFATDLSPDAAVSGQQILLRAERSPKGDGRVYEVHVTATDNHGGRCSAAVQVRVPHSLKDTAVNSGQTYNSFGP